MGHKRVKMELIKNERNRSNTYKKRKANLLKKMEEFSILCGVEACLVVFQPPNLTEDGGDQLQTWPSDRCSVDATIQRYRTSDGPKRCYHLSDYLAEKKKRVGVELSKINKLIYSRKFPTWDARIDRFSADQLKALLGKLDSKIETADQKLECFNLIPEHDQFLVPVRNFEQFGLASDYYGNDFQQVYCNDQSFQFGNHDQSSFMAMLNPNYFGSLYWDQVNNFGYYDDPPVNNLDNIGTELILSPEKTRTIDFETFGHHHLANQSEGQMVAAKVDNQTRRFGVYGGEQSMVTSSYGSSMEFGEYGMMSYSDGSYMNSGQTIQAPAEMQFQMSGSSYLQRQFSQELDGGGHQAFSGFEKLLICQSE